MSTEKEYTERRGSLLVLSLIIVLIIVIVIVGICVYLLVPGEQSRIILMILMALLILVGLSAFAFLEVMRRQAQRQKDMGATELVNRIYEEQRQQRSREDEYHEEKTQRWALAEPFRYSQRSTIKATV